MIDIKWKASEPWNLVLFAVEETAYFWLIIEENRWQ